MQRVHPSNTENSQVNKSTSDSIRSELQSWYQSVEPTYTGNDVALTADRYCNACRLPIRDRHFLSAVGRSWHSTCLVCSACRLPLDKQSKCYFSSDGMIYCQIDYIRRFVNNECSRCRLTIAPGELVMRIDTELVYHRDCFACVLCGRRFEPGQPYALSTDRLPYCPDDFKRKVFDLTKQCLRRDESTPFDDCDDGSATSTCPSGRRLLNPSVFRDDSELAGDLENIRQETTPATHATAASVPTQDGEHATLVTLDGYHGYGLIGRQQQRRTRTSFDSYQLRLMTTYFALNQNPDTNDLRQLAIRTGVSKKVLQVWFQNARAKYRRVSTGGRTSTEDNGRMFPLAENVDSSNVRQLYELLGITPIDERLVLSMSKDNAERN